MTEPWGDVVHGGQSLDEWGPTDLLRRLIELTQAGNEAAALSLLRQAAGVDD